MRRLAIASLILPVVGAFLLGAIFLGLLQQVLGSFLPSPPGGVVFSLSTSQVIAYAINSFYLILMFGPALVGFGLALFVLFAPAFGRKREGVPYAALGLCASALLLALLWGISAASWH